MASVNEAVDAARCGEPMSKSVIAGPPEDLADGITIEELGNLLAMRAQRAWFQGIQAGRADAMAMVERIHEEAKRTEGIKVQRQAMRLTTEHLSASAPLADAIQKARKAYDAGQRGKNTHERTKAREALGRALVECADAYAKFTAEMSA